MTTLILRDQTWKGEVSYMFVIPFIFALILLSGGCAAQGTPEVVEQRTEKLEISQESDSCEPGYSILLVLNPGLAVIDEDADQVKDESETNATQFTGTTAHRIMAPAVADSENPLEDCVAWREELSTSSFIPLVLEPATHGGEPRHVLWITSQGTRASECECFVPVEGGTTPVPETA